MSRRYESERVYNGVEVQVFAEDFERFFDEPFSHVPTAIYAELDGKEYELTQEQMDEVSIVASEWYNDDRC